MSEKIEWYQEVLTLEPGSRVFFPLARLFVDTNALEDAAITLRRGLARHPDYLEARMLYVDVLTKLEREDEVREQVEEIVSPLAQNEVFWRSWARSLPEEQSDLGVFIMLVAANLSGENITWTDVVFEGMSSLSQRLVGAPLPPPANNFRTPLPPTTINDIPEEQRPSFTLDSDSSDEESADSDTSFADNSVSDTLCTKTMAVLLASQGDTQGALNIYNELLRTAQSDKQRTDLQQRIAELNGGDVEISPPPSDDADVFSEHAKNRLISTLETLAARFEARVQA